MWKSQVELLNDRTQKIFISETKRVTYSEVIELWQHDEAFRSFFCSLLASAPFSAYFWETPPLTSTTAERAFEFVLVESARLANTSPDPSDFRQHFDANTEVVTFSNLSQDALLVVPCPTAKSEYPHIAAFVREAPRSQQHLLWQTVGRVLKQKLSEQPIWVSTSGLGVSWLHVRLDSRPKYYCFNQYKVLD